jgi:hydrogenase nickel incorporation protein HypB
MNNMIEIEIVKDVLDANRVVAEENRKILRQHAIFAINIMGSPGAGKTLILEQTLTHLENELPIGIIQGDIATTLDSQRLQRFDVPIIQINTERFGGDCHLGANLVRKAIKSLNLSEIQLLFIENVGNLVCPAEFDIGENLKMVVFSVTEGEEKPLKYPLMFRECELVLINKIDLLTHLDVRIDYLINNIRSVNPLSKIINLSATTGDGIDEWISYLLKRVHGTKKIKKSLGRKTNLRCE